MEMETAMGVAAFFGENGGGQKYSAIRADPVRFR
jgi:hypothetical protein